jgi:hypothetical protein
VCVYCTTPLLRDGLNFLKKLWQIMGKPPNAQFRLTRRFALLKNSRRSSRKHRWSVVSLKTSSLSRSSEDFERPVPRCKTLVQARSPKSVVSAASLLPWRFFNGGKSLQGRSSLTVLLQDSLGGSSSLQARWRFFKPPLALQALARLPLAVLQALLAVLQASSRRFLARPVLQASLGGSASPPLAVFNSPWQFKTSRAFPLEAFQTVFSNRTLEFLFRFNGWPLTTPTPTVI